MQTPSHRSDSNKGPRMRLASWMSFTCIVTLLACMAHRLASSIRCTKYASEAS